MTHYGLPSGSEGGDARISGVWALQLTGVGTTSCGWRSDRWLVPGEGPMRGLVRIVREKLLERREVRTCSLPDGPEDSFERFTGQRHSAAERYRRGESQVWVWLRERRVIEGDRDYLVVFDRLLREFHSHVLDAGIADDGLSGGIGSADDGGRRNELFVFIKDLQVCQVTKDLPHAPRSGSFVRLYRLDHAERFWGNATGNPQRIGAPDERNVTSGTTGPNRERCGGAWLAPIGSDELPSQMVKGTSEVVNAVPRKEAPVVGVGGWMVSPEDVLRSVVLDLGDESVGVTLSSSVEVPLEFVEMNIRTLDLDFNAVKRGDLPPPLAAHSLPLEEDAHEQRSRAETGGIS